MDAPNREFGLAGTLEELKTKGRLVVHGRHRPILVVYDRGRVFALDNRCPHMGFPLERGSVEDGILTCHWHHARFDLESGCTYDLWADDAPICPVEVRNGEVWVKTTFGHADPRSRVRCCAKMQASMPIKCWTRASDSSRRGATPTRVGIY
jgi:nitrite reductase/ring-hydroxylating ferredoxin subunit